MKNKKPAFPTVYDAQNRPTHLTEPGLTKLELISAMCLQGLLAGNKFTWIDDQEEAVSLAMKYAKEYFRQLEAEND